MKGAVIVVAALAVLAGCSARIDTQAVGEAVMEADRRFAAAVADHDMERFRGMIHRDAAFFGTTQLRGPAEVAEGWASIVSGDIGLSWAPDEVHVASAGDMAYTLGHAELRTTAADGTAVVSRVRYVTIWRKNEAGRWQAAVDAGTH